MHEEQRQRAHDLLKAQGIAHALFASRPNVTWLTGFAPPLQLGRHPFAGGPPLVYYAGGEWTLLVLDGYAEAAAASGLPVVGYLGYTIEAPIAGHDHLLAALRALVGGLSGPVGVEELFQQCDVVSIHIDGRPGNRGFVSGRLLGLMKPGVMFVNAARGMLIDTQALAGFLRANPNARAMLDVHDPEPFGRDYPLLGLANARLYPHLAARTEAAMTSMSWVVRDIVAVIEGRRPEFSAPRESAGG